MQMLKDLREFLETHYRNIERIRAEVWQQLENLQDEMVRWDVIDKDSRTMLADADYDGRVLHVVVRDYLPRRANALNNPQMRLLWSRSVADAVCKLNEKLGTQITFERVLVKIVAYVPKEIEWDADNRAFSCIINGLKFARVITNDDWQRLAFMVIGRVDKENPRTEIFVYEQPCNIVEK